MIGIFFLVLLFKAQANQIDITTSCDLTFCKSYQIANGVCDKACMIDACLYDSLSLEDFSTSDCFNDCRDLGCQESMLNNGECDSECNFYQCGWDLGDCGYCADGCTEELLNNEVCDEVCSFSQCAFDNNACGYCARGCFYEDLIGSECLPQCSFKECYSDSSLCLKSTCSPSCFLNENNDGVCNSACNTPFCNFDFGDCSCPSSCVNLESSSTCFRKNGLIDDECSEFSCGFKSGLCGFCAEDCFEDMLGNGLCEPSCNNPSCGFDHGDCGCALNCSVSFNRETKEFEDLKGEGCKAACLVEGCGYGTSFCSDLRQVKTAVLNSQVFQDFDRKPDLTYCYCETEKIEQMIDGTFVCDKNDECNVQSCLYCFGSTDQINDVNCTRGQEDRCFVCQSAMIKDLCIEKMTTCPLAFIESPSLIQLFKNGPKLWCLEDPTYFTFNQFLEIHVDVTMNYNYRDFGEGTLEKPINSIHYALISANAPFTKIYIESVENYFTFERIIFSPFIDNLNSPLETNRYLGQQELWIVGKSESGDVPVIYFKNSFRFVPRFLKTFLVNLNFSGKHFFSQCFQEICQYCKTYSFETGAALDDRGQIIEDIDILKYNLFCSKYHSTKVFEFANKAYIENVTFSEMRYQFNSLIKTNSTLELNYVNFIKLQSAPNGSVILIENTASNQRASLIYRRGEVKYLGSGYENIENVNTGSFLLGFKVSYTLIEAVNFSFNFLFSSIQSTLTNYLIYFKDFPGIIQIKDLTFSNNYLNYLIFIDVQSLEYDSPSSLQDLQQSKYELNHFTLSNCKFLKNYCSGGHIYYSMSQTLQNLELSNLEIKDSASGNDGIIKITNFKSLNNYEIEGGFTDITINDSLQKFWIEKRTLNLTSLLIQDSFTGGSAIYLEGLANVKIDDSTLRNIQEGTKESIMKLIKFYTDEGEYLSMIEDKEVPDMNCSNIFEISSSFNVFVNNLNVLNASCSINKGSSGLRILDSSGEVKLSKMKFLNITSSSLNGMLLHVENLKKVEISDLFMELCKNDLFSLVFISLTPVVNAWDVKAKALQSMYYAVFLVIECQELNFYDFSFENSTASFSQGGCVSLKASVKRLSASISNSTLSKCRSINSNGGGFYIDGISSDAMVTLRLKNISFIECSANDGGIIYMTNMISISPSEPSFIDQVSAKSCFADEGGSIALFHRQGILTISNLEISKSTGTGAGVSGYFTEGFLPLQIENFQITDSETENIFSFKSNKVISSVLMKNVLIQSNKALVFDLDFFNLTCFNLTVIDSTSVLVADMNSVVHLKDANFQFLHEQMAQVTKESTFLCENCIVERNLDFFITASESSSVVFKNSRIENNRFDRDHAFQLSEGFHMMQNVKFINNTSELFGIFSLIDLKISVISCNFLNNVIKNSNFLIITASDSHIEILSSFFQQEEVSKGSYLTFTINNKVHIRECSFSSSSSEFPTIFMNQGNISIENSIFSENYGQVLHSLSSKVSITSSKFQSSNLDLNESLSILEITSGDFFAESLIMSGFKLESQVDEASYLSLWKASKVEISQSLFIGSESQFMAVYARECSEVLVEFSTFQGFSSGNYGSLTFISFSTLMKSVLQEVILMNNTSEAYGGGIYSENVDLKVIDSNFTYNYARVKGGALFFISPDCDSCTFSIKGLSFFTFNTCDGQGGAVYWDDYKPSIENIYNLYDNSAKYGPNIASKPASLGPGGLMGPLIDVEKYIIVQNEVPPGQKLEYAIEIHLIDTYKGTISDDNSSLISLSVRATIESESSLVALAGTTEYQAREGVFFIDDISLFGVSGSSVELIVTSKAIQEKPVKNDETRYSSSASLLMNLRKCMKGETPFENRCTPCTKNLFSLKNNSECQDCPTGAVCPGGSALIVKKGYWRSSLESEIVETCIPPEACLEGNSTNELGDCSAGYTGKFCQSCQEGYSKTVSSVCSKCPDDQYNKLTAVGLFLVFLFFCVLLVKTTLKSAFTLKSIHSIYIKILINYIQLIFITTQINILWPTYLDSAVLLQRSAATLSERLFSLDCYLSTGSNVSSYYYKLILFALAPLVIFFASSVFWTGFGFYRESNVYMKRENFTSIIVLFFLIYPNILRVMFSHFLCRNVDKFGLYLNEMTEIRCWEADHLKYSKNLIVPCIVIWGFAAPTFILVYMVKIRKKLHIDHNRIVFGYLCNGFKQKTFYWEFLILYRKILMISIAVFLSLEPTMVQALTMIIALIISIYFQYAKSPYIKQELNTMEIKSLLIATVTIYSSLYFLPESIPQGYIIIVSFLIVTGNGYFLFSWIYFIGKAFVEILAKYLPTLKYWMKKGDAFEEEFNVEEVKRNGVFFDKDENKMYTFLMRDYRDDMPRLRFETENLMQMFFGVFLNEKDELE